MFIVWSGWGILVPVLNFLAFVGFLFTSEALRPLRPAGAFGAAVNPMLAGVWGLLAAGALFAIARKLEAHEPRVLVDQKTGQQVVFRRSAGSFFFVPTRYWAIITAVLWVALAILGDTNTLTKL